MHHLLTRAADDDSDRDRGRPRRAVPTRPGLGFEIDLDAVERARERPRASRARTDGPDHVRGDPQRARRGDGRDGADARAAAPTRRTSRRAPTSRARSSTPSCARSRRASPSPSTSARWSSRCRARSATTARRTSSPGDVIITNEPFPSGVHLNDVSLISPVSPRRRAARLRREPRAPRRRRRRRARVDRRLPRGLPGGRDHPAGEGRRRAAGSCDDVFELILAQIRSKHETGGDFRAQIAANATGVPQAAGARRPPRAARRSPATMRELLDYTERRTRAEIAALPHGVYEAEGSVDTDGYTDEPVRLQRADRDHGRRRRVRPDRLRPAAPRARQLDLRADVLGLRLRAQVPDRPRPARSTTASTGVVDLDAPEGTVTNCTWPSPVVGGWETQTRLVDVIFRALLPALPERLPGGDEGDDVPRRLRRRRPRTERVRTASSRRSAAATAAGSRATARTRCRRTARTPRTRRSRRPSSTTRCASRGSRSSRTPDGPGRFRGGLGLRKDFLFDRPTTFTVLADRDARAARRARSAGSTGKPAEYVLIRDGEETRLGAKATVELEAGDVVSYRTCGGGGYGPPAERDRERRRARRARGQGQRRARRARCTRWRVDPISFEVIRNALVAATDEMVLALKRSAYSTNIKTRSDFSCAFFDAAAALGRAGLRAAGAPRLDGASRCRRRSGATAPRTSAPGDVHRHERPAPERRPPERRQPDLARPPRRRADRLRREPRAPRRRRRRRARVDRRVPGGLPGGRDHPAGQARRGRRDRGRRLPARSSRRSARSTRPRGDFRAQIAANATGVRRVQALVDAARPRRRSCATMEELLEYTERRTRAELAALPHGVYEAEGSVDTDGYTDEPVRLRRAVEIDADGVALRH